MLRKNLGSSTEVGVTRKDFATLYIKHRSDWIENDLKKALIEEESVNAAMNKAVVDRAWTDAEGKVKMTPSPGSSRPRASCSTTTASCATCLAAAPPSRSCTSPTRRRPLH